METTWRTKGTVKSKMKAMTCGTFHGITSMEFFNNILNRKSHFNKKWEFKSLFMYVAGGFQLTTRESLVFIIHRYYYRKDKLLQPTTHSVNAETWCV